MGRIVQKIKNYSVNATLNLTTEYETYINYIFRKEKRQHDASQLIIGILSKILCIKTSKFIKIKNSIYYYSNKYTYKYTDKTKTHLTNITTKSVYL